jgi:hypothetical protein
MEGNDVANFFHHLLTDVWADCGAGHSMTREEIFASFPRLPRCPHWVRGWGWMALLGCPPATAQNCPCPSFQLPAIVRQAEVVFIGKSLTATNDSTDAGREGADDDGWLPGVEFQTRLAFDVESILKGHAPRFIEVVTPTGDCGFPFEVGKTYLVIGKRRGAPVSTDACQGNVSGHDAINARAAAIREVLHPARHRE